MRVADAGENRRNPVGDFNPRIGGFENRRGDVEAMPDFGPEPFGRIDAAALGDELGPVFGAEFGDLGCFAPTRMVLPEPALGRKIGLPPVAERQRTVFVVHRKGARPSRVDADADDFRGAKIGLGRGLRQRALDALLEAEQVVARILPGQMAVVRIEKNALRAGRIVDDPAAVFRPVRAANDESAHRVGAEIEAQSEHDVSSAHRRAASLPAGGAACVPPRRAMVALRMATPSRDGVAGNSSPVKPSPVKFSALVDARCRGEVDKSVIIILSYLSELGEGSVAERTRMSAKVRRRVIFAQSSVFLRRPLLRSSGAATMVASSMLGMGGSHEGCRFTRIAVFAAAAAGLR